METQEIENILSERRCDGCGKDCPLSSPRCGLGMRLADDLVLELTGKRPERTEGEGEGEVHGHHHGPRDHVHHQGGHHGHKHGKHHGHHGGHYHGHHHDE